MHMHIFDLSCIRFNHFLLLYPAEIFLPLALNFTKKQLQYISQQPSALYIQRPPALYFTKAPYLAVADGGRRLLTEWVGVRGA